MDMSIANQKMSVPAVAKIIVDRVRRRKRLHEFLAIGLRGLENQMEVIRHANE